MRILLIGVLFGFVTCLSGADGAEKLMTYSKDGITFSYPKSWKLSEENKDLGVKTISLKKGETTVVLALFPSKLVSPDRLLPLLKEKAKQEDGAKLVGIKKTILGQSVDGFKVTTVRVHRKRTHLFQMETYVVEAKKIDKVISINFSYFPKVSPLDSKAIESLIDSIQVAK